MLRVPAAVLDSIESLHLPHIPQVLLKFLHLAEDDNASIAELAELVGRDPALSARILTVANSPAVWRGVEAKSLTQCLVNLGTRLSRTLAACLIVQNFFSSAVDNQKYDYTGFWYHSLLLAETARSIAIETGNNDAGEAYLAGLLHDIGQLLLLGGMGKRYGRLLALCQDETALEQAEKRHLDTDHAIVGAWLADQWKLSSFMADAILFHHLSAEEIVSASPFCRIIWSAHVLCTPLPPETTMDLTAASAMLGLDISTLQTIYRTCAKSVALIAETLGFREGEGVHPFPTLYTPVSGPVSPKPDRSPLEDMVRDMALMHSLQQDLLSLGSEEDLLVEVHESARILFGMSSVALLLAQPDRDVLCGAATPGQPHMLQRLEIPLATSTSIASDVARGGGPLSTFERKASTPVSLADVQMGRILGCAGVLYVPLASHKQTIGVAAFGMSAERYRHIQGMLPWITSFGHLAAVSIETWRDMRGRDKRLESTVSKRYELQARRLIHEAKTPLSIIKNYLSIVRKKLADNHVLEELDILKEEIDRVASILRQMGGPADAIPCHGSLDINDVIENMFTLYGDTLFTGRGIASEMHLDPNLAAIDCDRDSVKQILINLWNNASDAMGAGDCFFISTHADVNHNGRQYLEIRLTDTGPGMPADVMRRLFKPLDPHRRLGHSGVGLSIVAGLVERLGGHITCQNMAGRGTSFSILLPNLKWTGA